MNSEGRPRAYDPANLAPSKLPTHIVGPTAANHTHTVIFIHGRGGSCSRFAEELLTHPLSDASSTLASVLPSYRWVFPTAEPRYCPIYQRKVPQWFEIQSMKDLHKRPDKQMDGIRASTEVLVKIMNEEIARLGEDRKKLFLCGVGQGGAIGVMTLLCHTSQLGPIGGFFGANCWLPFSDSIRKYLASSSGSSQIDHLTAGFLGEILGNTKTMSRSGRAQGLLRTPIFLTHSLDDSFVKPEMGRQAKGVLEAIGLKPEWKEYRGADKRGYWFKAPVQLEDIALFFERNGGVLVRETPMATWMDISILNP